MRQRAIDYRVGRAVAAVLAMTAIFRSGHPGRLSTRGARVILPASDEIILGARPGRLRQIGQKLILTEAPARSWVSASATAGRSSTARAAAADPGPKSKTARARARAGSGTRRSRESYHQSGP